MGKRGLGRNTWENKTYVIRNSTCRPQVYIPCIMISNIDIINRGMSSMAPYKTVLHTIGRI